MTDFNQEMYWREYQRRCALAAAAASTAAQQKIDTAYSQFINAINIDNSTEAVSNLLNVFNGKQIILKDVTTSSNTIKVKDQLDSIMNSISTIVKNGTQIVANIAIPEDANIDMLSSSYTIPTGATVIIGTTSTTSSRSTSEAYTIKSEGHLFRAEGGNLTINGGNYKVSGGSYVIRSGINPTSTKTIDDALPSKVTINDGTFESDSYVITTWGNSTTVINGGTFKSPSSIFAGNGNEWCANAKLTINGGTFEVTNNAEADGYTAVIGYWPVGKGVLTVTGGTFKINTPNCPATIFGIRAGEANITGGTYIMENYDSSLSGKFGDVSTLLPSGLFTVTANPGYIGEPTVNIATKLLAENNRIVAYDGVGEPANWEALFAEGTWSNISTYVDCYPISE